ncbi:methionine--tRNA ligase [Neorickettsia helminthoeca str. Oregon]|uniref:Methionine--tRNA ligase n=2 Tax=Neorickettsia helminthoeca TaxID=33994 RepID=X5H4Z0_9RICK|nr:methionine--tRNA ligase [Neorickettsia helminthoeca str. Oregon]
MRYYVTTPVYYVNDVPHIGHAYSSLIADIIARSLRMAGHEVLFTTGTDEHGQKVQNTARKLNISEKNFVDRISLRFRELCEVMQYQFSDFIRTTEARHKEAVKNVWNKLWQNELIYLGEYSGWYSERDECFYAETELQDDKAPTGAPVTWVKEASYFFRLSQLSEKLRKFYKENESFIRPRNRFNEALSFLEMGINDLSISRTKVEWGIAVPNDPSHTIYVWLDALTNYITSLGYPDISPDSKYSEFWENGHVIHIVGKDILRFHGIYWPAFLMGVGLKVPDIILAHGWWTNNGQKISKSLGNTIDPFELVSEFGVDSVRYFLIREVTIGNDGSFSKALLKDRINSELANNIGNLLQRTLTLVVKQCGSRVPEVPKLSNRLLELSYSLASDYKANMLKLSLNDSLEKIIHLATQANEYISQSEPWKLKNEPEKLHEILYTMLEALRIIGIALQPFIPGSAKAMLDSLAVPEEERAMENMTAASAIKFGTLIEKPSPVFKKHE